MLSHSSSIALSLQALSTLSSLVGVPVSSMESMLTQRVVVTRGEVFTKQLDVSNAELTRDAIVKSLFEVRRGWYRLSLRYTLDYVVV